MTFHDMTNIMVFSNPFRFTDGLARPLPQTAIMKPIVDGLPEKINPGAGFHPWLFCSASHVSAASPC